MRSLKVLAVVWFILFTLPNAVSAQQTATLTGVVVDPTGAVVPGVEVKLTDTRTGAERTTTTNAVGVYLFTNVRPGAGYSVMFALEGFRTFALTDIHIGVAANHTENVQLEVGTFAETVTVESAGEATLNTVDATVGGVLDTRRIKDLPIQLRNSPARLLGLQAGVVANTGGGSNRDGSVTGARTDQGNITLDGVDVNDQTGGFAFSTVVGAPIDTLQEFRTITSNPTALDGRSSGAQIIMITKSGTNNWHGSLRWFHRNTKTAANSFFNNKADVPVPKLIRNQFGGNIGGPIIKDRLFFFFDYEGRRDSSEEENFRTTPLAHVLQGQVAYINNGAGCTSSSDLASSPGCITILDAAQMAALDPQGIGSSTSLVSFLQSRYPVGDPTLGGNGVNTGGHRFNSPTPRESNIYTNRIDYTQGSHQLFGRWNLLRFKRDRTPVQQFAGDEVTTRSTNDDYSFAIGHTWTTQANINRFTFGFVKQIFDFQKPFRPSFPNDWDFGGFTDPFASMSSQGRNVPVPTIKNDFTHIAGRHTLQVGGSFKPIRQNTELTNDFTFIDVGLGGGILDLDSTLRPTDILSSTTAESQYDAIYTTLLGRIASVASQWNFNREGTNFPPGTGKTRNWNYDEYELYIQDSWRARSDLTINYGVRWQYYAVPFEGDGFQATNDIDFNNIWNIRQINALAGVAGLGSEPLLRYDLAGKENDTRGFSDPDLDNFAPRFSIAWNPGFTSGFLGGLFGDRKTVLRLGGSVTYDRVSGAITFIQDQVSYIFDNSASTLLGGINATDALLNNPRFININTAPLSNTPPVITRPFTPFVDSAGNPFGLATAEFNFAVAQDFRAPFSYNYTFSVQREVPGDMVVEVGYVGRLGRELFSQSDPNQVLDFLDVASGQRLFDAFQRMQLEVQNGSPITAQPWFENQMDSFSVASFGIPCTGFGVSSCTDLVAAFFGSLVDRGTLSDVVQALFFNGLLDFNVGMGSQFSVNSYISNLGRSQYNGLLVSVRKRYSQGLQFDLNYTFSNAIDTDSSVTNTVIGGLVWDLTDLKVGRGHSDFDTTHQINANWIYDLPFGRGRALGSGMPGWLSHIVGGWELAGIYTWRTGFAFSTTTGSFPVNFFIDSPGVLIGNTGLSESIHTDDSDNVQFFADPDVAKDQFAFPLGGTTGNRNTLRGPNFWNVDLGILKNFTMREGHTLQFRWEMFNTFNHPNFLEPNANLRSSAFGRITGQRGDPREMQFALRYDF